MAGSGSRAGFPDTTFSFMDFLPSAVSIINVLNRVVSAPLPRTTRVSGDVDASWVKMSIEEKPPIETGLNVTSNVSLAEGAMDPVSGNTVNWESDEVTDAIFKLASPKLETMRLSVSD